MRITAGTGGEGSGDVLNVRRKGQLVTEVTPGKVQRKSVGGPLGTTASLHVTTGTRLWLVDPHLETTAWTFPHFGSITTRGD